MSNLLQIYYILSFNGKCPSLNLDDGKEDSTLLSIEIVAVKCNTLWCAET